MKGSAYHRFGWMCFGGLLVLNGFVWILWPPGQSLPRQLALKGPFVHEQGHAFVADIPVALPSDGIQSQDSKVELYEQGVRVGTPHAPHEVIRKEGGGAFSHWGERLYFSATNNSDPNINGRTYILRYSATLPLSLYVGLLLVDFLICAFATERITRGWETKGIGNSLRVAGITMVTFLLIQAIFWVLTEHALAIHGKKTQQWFKYILRQGSAVDFAPGSSTNFIEHPYLNYALNAEMPYGERKQFNAEYRIRRSEPIRPRDKVRWRALALGGSTTFGELIANEEDTWVFQLEQRVRKQCGMTCDVINGGIGGYTVLENSIHYMILLYNLQPDVVLLYEGLNDVDARLFNVLTPDYSNYRIPWRSEGSVLPTANPVISWFYPYRYFLLSEVLKVKEIGIGGVVSPAHPPPSEWAAALERNRPDVYRSHLRNLVQLINGGNRRLVVLPQHFKVVNPEDEIFQMGVRQHNEVNHRVAEEFHLPFLDKLTAASTFVREDTFDNCHFNERGSVKMAEEIFQFLQQQELLPPKLLSRTT
jgi:lysophospholipase L1-like esterase